MKALRLLAGGLWLLAACSAGGGESSTTTVPAPPAITADPCALLSDEAVGTLSDVIERPGVADEVSGEHTCAWRNINGVAVVSLRVGSVGSSTLDEEVARVGLAGDRYVSVTDVGDEALAVFRGRTSAGQSERVDSILVRSGTAVVELRLPGLDIGSDADPLFATATALAGQAVAAI